MREVDQLPSNRGSQEALEAQVDQERPKMTKIDGSEINNH